MLLQLVGVFDAVGRVAHLVYGVPGDERRVSWRREDRRAWRHALGQRAPALAALMAPTSAARDTLELAAILRNTIHAEALEGIAVRSRAQTQYGVLVPSSDAEAFVGAARRRGGLERWGIRAIGNRQFLVAGDRFVEALVPDAARAISRLMRATDVTVLPGLSGTKLPNRPPRERDSVFDTGTRRRVRFLAGL